MPTPRNILVVDDDSIQHQRIRRLLPPDYGFLSASTAEEATTMLDQEAVDCVLLDHRLPGMSGLDFAPTVLERGVAVVLMTSAGTEELAVRALRMGCHDYLAKAALDALTLRRTIAGAIDRQALASEPTRTRQELEQFVQIAAHDLKAPVRHIRSFASLISNDLEDGELTEVPEYLTLILSAADRMSTLLDGLLRHTRVGLEPLRRVSVDLEPIVDGLFDEFREGEDAAQASFSRGALPTVDVDRALVQQLFQNLIQNALKYRGSEPPHVDVQAHRDGEMWRISVTDNGIGIAPEQAQRVFKPLVRLHAQSSIPGTGLGLATCEKVVRQHGGTIGVESIEGQGCTFWFTLPDDAAGRPATR